MGKETKEVGEGYKPKFKSQCKLKKVAKVMSNQES